MLKYWCWTKAKRIERKIQVKNKKENNAVKLTFYSFLFIFLFLMLKNCQLTRRSLMPQICFLQKKILTIIAIYLLSVFHFFSTSFQSIWRLYILFTPSFARLMIEWINKIQILLFIHFTSYCLHSLMMVVLVVVVA